MYLSRLTINLRDRRARRDLADCQELHRTLLSVWPQRDGPSGARAQFGLLHRLEADTHSGSVRVLVQSREAPGWDRLPEGYLLAHETKSLDGTSDALSQGTRLRFRLRANPTKKVNTKSGPNGERRNGKRVDFRREGDQIAWLERKGREQCGFRLTSAQVRAGVPNLRIQPEQRSLGGRGDSRITFGSVLFEGELEVTDPDAFRKALESGIGSGKAYGFGLLSIAPRRT